MVRPLHILLVEDNQAFRLTLGAVLEDAGHRVACAGSVSAARVLLDTHRFEAALVDLHLPDGSGSELVVELRQRDPAMLVALISGSASSTDRTAADVHFDKSGDPELLLRLID